MNNKIKLISLLIMVSISFGLATNAVSKKTIKPVEKTKAVVEKTVSPKPVTMSSDEVSAYTSVKALDVVANPSKYLNKKIKIKAKFDKFSTLGLDYKPAYKSSEKYITFLIKRDDVVDHTIPLSEMKNFVKREVAEKYIDLSSGDEIEFSGTVFSNALGDAWIDVEKFVVLSQKTKENKK